MSNTEKGRDVQGQDPKNVVFQGLASVVYAAEAGVSGGYIDQSRTVAAIAEYACDGMRGKAVLDVGCGYGTTTMALLRHAPKRIVAVDTSRAHIELLSSVLTDPEDLDVFLRRCGAPAVLGRLYDGTLAHFRAMREEYRSSLFRLAGGTLSAKEASSLDLTREVTEGPVDAVVGNNWLHWPVNQRRAVYKAEGVAEDEGFTRAVTEALAPLTAVLVPGGVAVLLEPNDFAWDDEDPRWDGMLEQQTMSSHPVFLGFQEAMNRILKADYGIDRAVPKTARLFPKSRMAGLFAGAGLQLERSCFCEGTFSCDPINACFVRAPMWLGAVALPFDTKMAILECVVHELRETLSAKQLALPIRGEYTIYVARRV